MVVGIKSYSVNLPRRILRVHQGSSSTSMLGPDEDLFTLGVGAALKMDRGFETVQRVFFATNGSPFVDRSLATQLCPYLNLGCEVECYDLQGSRRSGMQALLAGMRMSQSGEDSLVIISDGGTRASRCEDDGFGYGAVAFLVGVGESEDQFLATLVSRSIVQSALLDEWQVESRHEGFVEHHHGDHRFARTLGYEDSVSLALKGVMSDLGWEAKDVDRCVVYSPDKKTGGAFLKRHGFDLKRHHSDFISSRWGLTGAAHTSLMMVAELENAQVGTRLLVLNYGEGADASLWKVQRVKRQGFLEEPSISLTNDHFSKLSQNLLKAKESASGFTSEIMEHRNRNLWQGRIGKQCLNCEAILTLPLPGCPRCGDSKWKEFPLALTGECFSITWEHYYPSQESPQGMAVIRLDGGGQLTLQVADSIESSDSQRMDVGDRVELVLRRIHNLGGRPGYFWKCRKILDHQISQQGDSK